ncbi:MAG: pitrilysin family protein [Acidobacteria bacterium]|nr:pitrilysin family protein [Acidobacteriota bacterium]
MLRHRLPALAAALFLVSGAFLATAQDLASFNEKTTVHTLDNGWTFIIVERPVAPVFSFATYANVGAAQEIPGITGLAHMFEHMAFKGTPNIGTTNYKAEKRAIEELEAAYQVMQTERLSPRSDPERLQQLEARFKEMEKKADEYVIKNEFGDIIDREGGTGLNAFTNSDVTGYFYSLPANKFELMAYLESERFLHPVFREFYKERDVVKEERRMRIESQPFRRLLEQIVSAAFQAHPYHQPVVGYMSDLNSITITDAEDFYRTYYVPSNLVTAVVGDIKADEILPIIEKYFGRIPVGPAPPALRTVEPTQIAEKTVVLKDPSQPMYLEAYHKPAATDIDEPVYDAIDDILFTGRTSRMYRSLVRDKKIAIAAQSFTGFPGNKYPGLWFALAVPSRDASTEEVQTAVRAELERLKIEDVSDEELARFKTRAKADLVRSLRSNQGLAENLARYHTLFGDWRELFRYIDRLDAVTKADIRRVANVVFKDSNRTVGMIVTETAQADEDKGSAQGES